MRLRTKLAIATLVLIAGVAAYQAMHSEPPQQNVRIVRSRPIPPIATYECVDGMRVIHYRSSDLREFDTPTNEPCD